MPKLSEFTRDFQERYRKYKGLEKLSDQDKATELSLEDLKSFYRDGQWPTIWLSPKAGGDLRHLRPYYLLPLLETADPGEQELLREEMLEAAAQLDKPVTDLFVMSHGWHRNYFDAVSVYDRLLSRFQFLLRRGRISSSNPEFSPLFLAVHWHSDPGKNGWVDIRGRRKLKSFWELGREFFEPDYAQGGSLGKMRTDFEDLYSFLSHMSAPGIDALQGSKSTRAEELTTILDAYRLREGQGGEPVSEKVTALWRCFFEAESEKPLVDQSDRAKNVSPPWASLQTLVRFILAIVLPLGLINLGLFKSIASYLGELSFIQTAQKWLEAMGSSLLSVLRLEDVWFNYPAAQWPIALGIYCFFAACLLYLVGVWRRQLDPSEGMPTEARRNNGFPVLQLLLWLPLQLVTALPILIFLFTTYIFRTPYVLLAPVFWFWPGGNVFGMDSSLLGWIVFGVCTLYAIVTAVLQVPLMGLFNEKLKHRHDRSVNTRDILSAIGRWPIKLVRRTIAQDSLVFTMTGAIDNQFAFFEMQRKGVDAGRDLGRFLERLLAAWPDRGGSTVPRIHLIGHSFGGLVVHNAFDRLFSPWQPRQKPKMFAPDWQERQLKSALESQGEHRVQLDEATTRKLQERLSIHSLCLINSATASSWFHDRKNLVGKVTGSITSIYSKYDSANSFWYPLANNGRVAAGSVGLWERTFEGTGLNILDPINRIATVVKPPNCVLNPKKAPPVLLNLDASRIAFDGPIATGGGHDDIFKDELVHLLWGVSQIQVQPAP